MDIAFCIHAYHELHITTSKILTVERRIFFILDGNLLYRTVIGGKEFVHIVYKDLEVTEKEL